MNKNKPTLLTEQELSVLSGLCLNMEYLKEKASRCDSLIDIFAEALESMHRDGTEPLDGATYGNVAEVIREYSIAVKNGVIDAHSVISKLFGKGGECCE